MISRFWSFLSPTGEHANLSVRTKVLLPPVAAIMMLGPLLYLLFADLDRGTMIAFERMRQEQVVLVQALALPQNFLQVRTDLYRVGLGRSTDGGDAEIGRARESLLRGLARLSDKAAALEATGLEGAGTLARGVGVYAESVGRALDRIAREPAASSQALRRTEIHFEELARRAGSLAAQTSRRLARLTDEATARRTTHGHVFVTAGAGTLVLLVALLSSRSIAWPLERLLGAIRHLRRGDLDKVIPMTERRDEFGEFARAIARLRQILIERRSREEERERERRILDHMAHHDRLTGLPNRPLAERFLSRAFIDRRTKRMPLALLVLDLDGFKPVNDIHGHAAGDAVLVEIAKRLEGVVRAGDLAARIGGDEFAVVLSGVQRREDVDRLAARVAEVLETPIEWNGRSLLIGGSIGGALSSDSGSSVEALFGAADAAMYATKEDPRAQWSIYVPPSEAQAEERRRDRPELEKAIRGRKILTCFQPVVRLADRGHAGFTVHLRWRHPQKGVVPIDELLSEVERAGLVGEMTLNGLHDLLAMLEGWIGEGLDPGWTSVIPPPAMLASDSAVHDLEALVPQFPRAAERLTIEIPESALKRRAEAAILRSLVRLRERQVRTALSGFGRHDGSLALLGENAFDEVRISRRIIAGLGKERRAEVMVEAFIDVATGLGIEVMARGVETEEQEEHLRRLGCRYATGPRYGGPTLEPGQAREQLAAALDPKVAQSS